MRGSWKRWMSLSPHAESLMPSGFCITTDITALTNIPDLRRHASFKLTRASICLHVSSDTSVDVTYPCTGNTRIKCASRPCRTFGGPKNTSGTGVHAQPPGRVRTVLVPMRLIRVAVSQAIDAASSPCVQMSGIQGLGDWRGRPSFCSSGFGLYRPYWTRVLACMLHMHVWLCVRRRGFLRVCYICMFGSV